MTDTTGASGPEAAAPETEQPAEQPDPLKKLQDELAEAKDKFVRLYAEFENHRRRTAKEKLEMIQSANEQLIKALLPVSDDFERAEKSFRDKNDKELGYVVTPSGSIQKYDPKTNTTSVIATNAPSDSSDPAAPIPPKMATPPNINISINHEK